MGWSPAEISLLAVELLSALALAVLWLGDRERTYTLWWAISHLVLPLPSLLMGHIHEHNTTSNFVAMLLCLNVAIQASTLLAGVISYRAERPLRSRQVGLAIVALLSLYYLPMLIFGIGWARLMMVLSMVAALLASAALMWSLGRVERLAAICFGMRGGFEIGLLALIASGHGNSAWFAHIPSFNALMAICTVLALLIAAYQRSLDRLRDQYRFLELSHEITAQLQGVSDETNLAQQVLTVIVERLRWKQGIFFRPLDTDETLSLIPIASYGPADTRKVEIGMPIATPSNGMIAIAARTRRICHSASLKSDPRVTETFRDHPLVASNPSMVVIPVTHDGNVLGIIALRDSERREFRDTELRTLESLGQVIGISVANARNLHELAYRANHDTLTGLGNRAALHDYLRDNMANSAAVLLFDLDHFKQVNDALGHAVGDKLLQAMAQRLQQYLGGRPAQLFRLGGDEFVIIHALGSGGQEAALTMARELAEVIAQPLQIGELSLRTPASIGVALALDQGDDSHELLRCADVAMYHAKQRGSGVALYERKIDAYKLEHLTLLSAVNEGLEQNQFALFYQPVINLATGAVEGCEGLIRWYHPTLGLIGAGEFMPLVEATDLIRALTHRVVDIAMADAARWQQRGIDTRIAINLSARNILDPELPDYLLRAAVRHRVEPRRIELEITETILINDPTSATKVLQRLADVGFTLALDDFGTGYSSLAYLTRFPIHTLKIDRSFVREMLAQAGSRAIVESTISLARGLSLKVTAEGVELEEEAQLLRELGCDSAQGYLFSRPLPEAQLMAAWRHVKVTAL